MWSSIYTQILVSVYYFHFGVTENWWSDWFFPLTIRQGFSSSRKIFFGTQFTYPTVHWTHVPQFSWIICESCSFWCRTVLVGGINNHKNQWRSEYGKYYQSSWITFSWPFRWCNYSAMIKDTIKAYFYKRHKLLKIRLWVSYFIYFKFTHVSSKVFQSLHL